jgi:hypothetical protein
VAAVRLLEEMLNSLLVFAVVCGLIVGAVAGGLTALTVFLSPIIAVVLIFGRHG